MLVAAFVVVSMALLAIDSKGPILAPIILGLMMLGLIKPCDGAVRGVLRSQAYPGRHWTRTRGCLPLAIVITFILGALILPLIMTVRFDTPVGAALAGGVLLFLLINLAKGVSENYHHVRVLPYFESKVAEIDTYCSGKSLARHVLDLDEMARGCGVVPLSEFGWNDDFAGEELVWHSSASGLKTVNTLLAQLQIEEIARHEDDGLIDDLKRISHALGRAEQAGIRFCLILEHGDYTNGMEHEQAQGKLL